MFCFSVKAKKGKTGGLSTENLPQMAPAGKCAPLARDHLAQTHKVAMLGATGVGKTAICQRMKGTMSEGHFEVTDEVDDELTTLIITDTTVAFPSRYKNANLRKPVQEAEGYILVYSVTERRSLTTIHQLITYIRCVKKNNDLPVVLVGNKMDSSLERCVSQEEGRQLAFDLGVAFYETSTRLTLEHVTKIFHDLVRQIRCVWTRRDFEREQDRYGRGGCTPLCGARGLVDRISFRSRNRRKLLLSDATQ